MAPAHCSLFLTLACDARRGYTIGARSLVFSHVIDRDGCFGGGCAIKRYDGGAATNEGGCGMGRPRVVGGGKCCRGQGVCGDIRHMVTPALALTSVNNINLRILTALLFWPAEQTKLPCLPNQDGTPHKASFLVDRPRPCEGGGFLHRHKWRRLCETETSR